MKAKQIVLMGLVGLASCTPPSSPTPEAVAPAGQSVVASLTLLQAGFQTLGTTGTPINLEVDLGPQPGTVDLLLTNANDRSVGASYPVITSTLSARSQAVSAAWVNGTLPRRSARSLVASSYAPGTSRVAFTDAAAVPTATNPSPGPVPTTLRWAGTDPRGGSNARTLYLWVADNCWNGYATSHPLAMDTVPYEVTDAMLVDLAGRFLNTDPTAGPDRGTQDIYHWVTALYGKEYFDQGETPPYQPTALIPGNNEIHIFLVDIEGDRSIKGGTVGYFYSGDETYQGSSNQKILFALDAPMFANPNRDGSGTVPSNEVWTTNSYWPNTAISTLAHEFQHMIQHFQKGLLHNVVDADPWIDEMCSMVTEDLLADKLGIPGPRGVPQTPGAYDYSPGTISDNDGRLNDFVSRYSLWSLTMAWSEGDTLWHYGAAYGFGSWLARNYGGVPLLRDIVTNPRGDVRAIVDAVNRIRANQSPITFGDLAVNWALSYLAAPGTGVTVPFRLSAPEAIPAYRIDAGEGYFLGSIDYFRYQDRTKTSVGPTTYLVLPTGFLANLGGGSSYAYRIENGVSGIRRYNIDLSSGLTLTVIRR